MGRFFILTVKTIFIECKQMKKLPAQYHIYCLKLLIFLIFSSCSDSAQPQCSDRLVLETLKQAYVKNIPLDTGEIKLNEIRTLGKNEKFKSCDCAAHATLSAKPGTLLSLIPIDQDLFYSAQYTDDEKEVVVEIKNK